MLLKNKIHSSHCLNSVVDPDPYWIRIQDVSI